MRGGTPQSGEGGLTTTGVENARVTCSTLAPFLKRNEGWKGKQAQTKKRGGWPGNPLSKTISFFCKGLGGGCGSKLLLGCHQSYENGVLQNRISGGTKLGTALYSGVPNACTSRIMKLTPVPPICICIDSFTAVRFAVRFRWNLTAVGIASPNPLEELIKDRNSTAY